MNATHDRIAHADPTPFWVTRRGARIALIAAHVAAALSLLVELVYPITGPIVGDAHGAERVAALEFFASYAIYGFVGCCVLVMLGRVLRRLTMRAEHYYDNGGGDESAGDGSGGDG